MRLVITLLLATLFGHSSAQNANNTDRHNDKNIYYQALKQYLDFRAADSFYVNLKRIDTLYVYDDTKTTDSLLDRIGLTKIKMIDDPYSFIKRRKGEGFTLYSIFPLNFDGKEFSVSFVPFIVSLDRKRKQGLLFSNPGSYKIVFNYNGGQFTFVRLEDHGI